VCVKYSSVGLIFIFIRNVNKEEGNEPGEVTILLCCYIYSVFPIFVSNRSVVLFEISSALYYCKGSMLTV
jgi:hypothetical protein